MQKFKKMRFWGNFEPGFGFLGLFWANSAHVQPQGTLGGEFWGKTKFQNAILPPHLETPPICAPVSVGVDRL